MPIIDLENPGLAAPIDTPKGFAVTPGAVDVDHGQDAPVERPAWSSTMAAAFRQDNTVGALFSAEDRDSPVYKEPGFNPWDSIKGTKYEPQWSSFTDVRNTRAADDRKRQIDLETEDRKTLAASPWYQRVPSELVAGGLDIPTLLPGGAFVKGVNGGIAVGKTAASVAAAAGISSAAQEAALQNIQATRELSESVTNIGASVLLGGVLGAGGAKLLSHGEWAKGVEALNADIARAGEPTNVNNLHVVDTHPEFARLDAEYRSAKDAAFRANQDWQDAIELHGKHSEEANAALKVADDLAAKRDALDHQLNEWKPPEASSGAPRSIGAAAHEPVGIEGNSVAGAVAGTLASATSRLNPALRILESPSAATREVGTGLFENSLYLKKNMEGVASEPAVETLMKEWNGGLAKAVQSINETFPEYRKAGGDLSNEEFRESVGRAMRRGDQDPNPHVQKVAQEWRSQVFDPLKEAAIKAGLLPKDVSVETAESYFSRMWNKNKLIAQEGKIKGIVEDYYTKKLGEEFSTSVEAHTQRMARLDQEAADLSLTPEQRISESANIKTALETLEKTKPDLAEVAARLGELRQRQIEAADTPSHPVGADEYKAQQKALKEYGGDELKQFMAERANLRTRKRNIDLGVAGMQERSDRVLHQIADIEDANHNTMERLVKKGQRLERDLDRLDADAFDARVNEIIESYSTVARKSDNAARHAEQQIENIKKAAERGSEKRLEAAQRAEAEALTGPPEEIAAKRAAAKAAGDAEKAKQEARDTKITQVLEREAEQQRKLSERMGKISERLEAARGFDHDALMDEIRIATEKATRETSSLSLARGERVAKLSERMEAFDPAKVVERTKTIAQMKKELEAKFVDRWEVGRGAIDVNPANKSAQFKEAAKQISEEVFNTLTGKTGGGSRPEFITIQSRGPMKERTFHIPDKLIEDFLESDVEHVGRRYARVMGADVELANKYGSVDMKDQIAKIREDYANLRSGLTDEKQLTKLGKQETADIRDIEALRDLLRGTRQESPLEQNYSRLIRSANHVNYIRSMGEVVLASLTDTIRPAMVHGLIPFIGTTANLATNLKAIKMSVHEAQLAGNVTEAVLGHRLATLSEIGDPYAARGPIEAFLENMTNVASKWNGIRMWTDGMKSVASVMTQNRILKGAENYANLPAKEKSYLAFLGIDQSMAERIAAQYAEHGENLSGVRVANTEKWGETAADAVALRTFRAAINKDVDSTIIQKSVADVPLFASTPTGKAILQFKSFTLASHQKILLRGLQEDQARFLGGVVAMTAMGMFQTWLKAVTGNRTEKLSDIKDNPGWWVGEGLDRAGVIGPMMEISNSLEKIAGINPIKAPIKAFDVGNAMSQKNQNKNDLGAVLGPTFGLVQNAGNVLGIPQTIAKGEEVTKAQKNSAVQLMPFNSYFGVRQIMNYLVNPPQ